MRGAEGRPPTVLEGVETGSWLWEPGEIKVVPLGRPAAFADLRRTELKAEIVGGEPRVIGLYECEVGGGETMMSRIAFILDLQHRQSICPGVSWFTGPLAGWDFPYGAHMFAVEVRDAINYGDEANQRCTAKRAD